MIANATPTESMQQWRENGVVEVEDVQYPTFGSDFAVYCAWKDSNNPDLDRDNSDTDSEDLVFSNGNYLKKNTSTFDQGAGDQKEMENSTPLLSQRPAGLTRVSRKQWPLLTKDETQKLVETGRKYISSTGRDVGRQAPVVHYRCDMENEMGLGKDELYPTPIVSDCSSTCSSVATAGWEYMDWDPEAAAERRLCRGWSFDDPEAAAVAGVDYHEADVAESESEEVVLIENSYTGEAYEQFIFETSLGEKSYKEHMDGVSLTSLMHCAPPEIEQIKYDVDVNNQLENLLDAQEASSTGDSIVDNSHTGEMEQLIFDASKVLEDRGHGMSLTSLMNISLAVPPVPQTEHDATWKTI